MSRNVQVALHSNEIYAFEMLSPRSLSVCRLGVVAV